MSLKKRTRMCSNVLLQALDDGRLTDGQGRTVDFKKYYHRFRISSNVGSYVLAAQAEGWVAAAMVQGGEEARGLRDDFHAGVPQPAGRDHPVPSSATRRHGQHRDDPVAPAKKALLADRKINLELDKPAIA